MKAQVSVATGLATALVLSSPLAGLAEPSDRSGAAATPESSTRSADPVDALRWQTLATGDRVAYRTTGDAVDVLGIRPAPGSSGIYRTVQLGDRVRVVPAEAQPLIDDGTLDADRFEIAAPGQPDDMAVEPSLAPCDRVDNPNEPGPDKAPVTVTALDRRGESTSGHFLLHAYHCRPWEGYGYIEFGTGPDGRTFHLPPGSYSVMGDITTMDASGRFPQELTVGGDLQIDITAGDTAARDVVVDARDAVPLDADTPRESETAVAVLGWTRGAEDHRLVTSVIVTPQYSPLSRLSVIPADPIEDGEFDFFPTFRQTAPLVEAEGAGLPDLRPKLLPGSPRVEFDRRLRLVDAAHACEGCAVLVREDVSTGLAGPVTDAVQKGAAAVLVMPSQPGTVHGSVAAGPPVLAVSYAEGQALTDRLRGRRTWLRVQVTPHPPYLYDLAMHETDELPDDLVYDIDAGDVRRIEQRFHGDGTERTMFETRYPLEPCRCSLTPIFGDLLTGTTRTDYVLDDAVWQQQLFRPGITLRDEGEPFDPTTPHVVDWMAGPLVPGLPRGLAIDHYRFPALTQDGSLILRVPSIVDAAGHGGNLGTATGRLLRDGQVVAELTGGGYATVPAGTEPATWRLELEHAHAPEQWATATSGSVAWTFRAGGEDGTGPQPVPLIDTRIELPVTLDGDPTWPLQRVVVEPWRLDGTPARVESIRLELSTDGGASWDRVPLWKVGREYWTLRLPRGDGPVSMRVRVTDRNGSTVERTIHDAWID